MTTTIDTTQYSSVSRSNSRITKSFYPLASLGLVLPFVLPESAWLADSYVFQKLNVLIPVAHKLAGAARFPNVVFGYIIIMLTVSFLVGVGNFLFLESRRDYLRLSLVRNAPHGRWNLWLKALGGCFFFSALLALCYIFPSQPTGDSHGSRGQFIVSFMLATKPGLAIFGAIATVGLASGWLALCLVVYNFFNIPFLGSDKQ